MLKKEIKFGDILVSKPSYKIVGVVVEVEDKYFIVLYFEKNTKKSFKLDEDFPDVIFVAKDRIIVKDESIQLILSLVECVLTREDKLNSLTKTTFDYNA
jgi:hypothetical protein